MVGSVSLIYARTQKFGMSANLPIVLNFIFTIPKCLVKQYYGTKCNSLTQQFIVISITIDTWATCFESY